MKARRKSDGKIIEVRRWRGASDVIYSSPDMNQFYQASDLDFNVDSEEIVISGWLSREKDGDLYIYTCKPERNSSRGCWVGNVADVTPSNDLFPDLTWESEPLQVEIILKRKKK